MQAAASKLNITIVQGDGAIDDVHQHTARELIVQVDDDNKKPVPGAAVVFSAPGQGAGGSFAGGARSLSVMTDNRGRAVARGFHPNHVEGQYHVQVTASHGGQIANASIGRTNMLSTSTTASAGISKRSIALIVIAGAAAAAGGGYYATHNGGNGNSNAAITITPGSSTVGPPR